MSRSSLLSLFSLLTFLTGFSCARYNQRVPDALLDKLPYEARIELLEAENDLALSIDRLDEAAAEVDRTKEALKRAKSRLDAAEDEVDAADDKVSEEVAELAVVEGEARVTYLRAKQQVNLRKVEIHALALRCAHARFQQARLAVARKVKVEGSESLSPQDFEEQTRACEAEVQQENTEAKELFAEATAAKEAWDKGKAALAKKTFDARASPYVE